MFTTRRPVALLIALAAGLTACSSSSPPEGAHGADREDPAVSPDEMPADPGGSAGSTPHPDTPDGPDTPDAPDGNDGPGGRAEDGHDGPWDTGPASIAAIGDSITTGFDACELLADCPEVSWATGTESAVSSVADRLDAADTWNEAEAGARMADLPEQAARAAAHRPELVTVLMGANDACTPTVEEMTEPEEFRADLTEGLTLLREETPDTQVFVASLPDLQRLWSAGKDEPAARTAWQFGICPSLLGDPQAETAEAEERRAAVRARTEEFNSVLEEVCSAEPTCRHDGGAVHDYTFGVSELSPWDWFHPSREGQRELARIAHGAITEN